MSKRDDLPFELAKQIGRSCLCLFVQRAGRAVARRFDDVLRPLDLTNGQFSLLMSLNRPLPATIGYIAGILAMNRTTLTANLKPLERRGLLKVTVDPDDNRSRLLSLTPAGRKLLVAAVPIWKETHAAIERALVRSDPDALRADLRALSHGLQ